VGTKMTYRRAPDSEIHFERLALTPEQIAVWDLPTRPNKASDTRSKNFGVLKAAEQSEREIITRLVEGLSS
jgi:hypothetical protein